MRRAAYIVAVVMLSALCGGCGVRRVPVRSERADSVRVVREIEYRERLRDTVVYVPVPVESREALRRDSSRLETSVAVSEARIGPDGLLRHTLTNKPARLPAAVQVRDVERTERRDSAAVRELRVEVPVSLPPSRWQRFWAASGRMAWGLLAVSLTMLIIRKRSRG